MKIGFIGIGKLGMPCAEVIALNGHDVVGYDVDHKSSNLVKIKNTIQECVVDREIVFVAVPTPHDIRYDGRTPTTFLEPRDFSYDIVKDVIIEANRYMNKNQLLVLISTVLPGTVRREFTPLIKNTRFVYNPYLIAMGSVAWDMINPEMVMIGTDNGSENGDAKQLVDFYKTIMKNDPRYVIGTWDECECIKVFYNTFISTKLSLVNMIQDVAERQGNINVDIVTEALANSTMRIMGPQYMKAGMGDGGACHPRDNIALRYLAKELDLGYDLFDSIMIAREQQAKNISLKLIELAKKHNLKDIYIHGKAYKPGVEYCDGSYSLLIGHFIEELKYKPTYIDPFTNDVINPTAPGVFLLAHSASTTYKYTKNSNLVFDSTYCLIPDNSVVLDPWRNYHNNKCTVIHYGNTRQ
jgi:UDPglucose 6-dehydrogenase